MAKDDKTITRGDIQHGVDGWRLINILPDKTEVWQQPQGWFMYRENKGQTYFIGRTKQELNDWLKRNQGI